MQITFKDGKRANVDTNLNIKKLMLINRDFNTDEVVTISFNQNGGQDINLITASKATYVAYRQANMNDYISWETFLDTWNQNQTDALKIYAELLSGQSKQGDFQKSFKTTKKHQGASSSRN